MTDKFLKLNHKKTEEIKFGTKHSLSESHFHYFNLYRINIKVVEKIKASDALWTNTLMVQFSDRSDTGFNHTTSDFNEN